MSLYFCISSYFSDFSFVGIICTSLYFCGWASKLSDYVFGGFRKPLYELFWEWIGFCELLFRTLWV